MNSLPLFSVLVAIAVSSSPLFSQTVIKCQAHDSDYFSSPAAEGSYDLYPDTGVATRTGSLLGVAPWDMDSWGNGGTIWVTDDSRGSSRIMSSAGHNFPPAFCIDTIASGRDGFLYGDCWGGDFYRIDPDFGGLTHLGIGPNYSGICVMPDGRMLGVISNQLYLIDRNTGAGTVILTLSENIGDLACSHNGRLFGIGPLFSSSFGKLFEIDQITGSAVYKMNLPVIQGWSSYSIGSEPGAFQGKDNLLLSGPTAVTPGSSASYQVSGGPSHGNYALLASTSATGDFWFQGQPFDLGLPVRKVLTGNLDSGGSTTILVDVPVGAAGVTMFLEVGARSGTEPPLDSNFLTVVAS